MFLRYLSLIIILNTFCESLYAQNSRIWATYYGGSSNEAVEDIAVDASGNIYIAGSTFSTTNIASGGFQNTAGGGNDAYIAKFDAAGNRIWASYYGGTGWEFGKTVATDASGNVYLAGATESTAGISFGGFQNAYGGGSYDGFLVKFDANGNRLWATYYGGSGSDWIWGINTDASGNVYLAGDSPSLTGIASGGFQNTYGGGTSDGFLVKFDSNGNRIWGTYYGGAGSGAEKALCVAADASGNIYLAGYTPATTNIASGGFQNSNGGGTSDGFLVKFDSNGNRIWGTYYGASGYDTFNDVVTDASGNIYLAGQTTSTSAIAASGFQNTSGGTWEAFLVKFDPTGNRIWGTYYGGSNADYGQGVDVDASGNVYLGGIARSTNNVASGGFQDTYGGGTSNAFLVKFDNNCNRFCATYYGGTGDDYGNRIAVDPSGNAYLAGRFESTNLASGGFQNTYGGGNTDGILIKFTSCTLPLTATTSSTDVECNGFCTGTATITASDGSPPYTYSWSNNQTTQTVNGLCAGTYTCTVKDSVMDSVVVTVVINEPVAINTVFTQTTGSCPELCNGSATVSASGGTPGYTYLWPSTVSGNVTAFDLCSGTDTVIITDANGCKDTILYTIPLLPSPTVLISGNDTICEGENTVLTALGADTYVWNTGSTDQSLTTQPALNAVYSVIGTDSTGCSDTSTVTVVVQSVAFADFSIDPNEGPIPLTVNFTNNSLNANYYEWFYGDSSDVDTTFNAQHLYTEGGEYIVQLIANNSDNCPDTAYSTVHAETQSALWIPNSFSPNADGINDLFEIKATGIVKIDIRIFNRWGELLYQSDLLSESWDGKYKVLPAEPGVYVYTVKATGIDGLIYQRRGHVNLIR